MVVPSAFVNVLDIVVKVCEGRETERSPECVHLFGGDLERREEVDPLDSLGAGRAGEGARVGGVGSGGGQVQRSNASQEMVQLSRETLS